MPQSTICAILSPKQSYMIVTQNYTPLLTPDTMSTFRPHKYSQHIQPNSRRSLGHNITQTVAPKCQGWLGVVAVGRIRSLNRLSKS
jgi:hypothetical protein